MTNKDRVMQLVREGKLSLTEALELLEKDETATHSDEISIEQLEIVNQRLRELEVMEMLDDLTEEMVAQKIELELTKKHLEHQLGVKESFQPKKEAKAHQAFNAEETLQEAKEFLHKLGQEASKEGQKFGEQAKDYFETFHQRFEKKNVNLSLPWLKQTSLHFEKSYHIADLQAMTINLNRSSVEIKTHDESHIYIHGEVVFTGHSDQPTQEDFEELLTIDQANQHFTFKASSPLIAMKMIVYVPQQTYTNVSLHSNYGTVSIHQMHTQQLSIDAKIGDIVLEQVEAEKVSLQSLHGDITIVNSDFQFVQTQQANGNLRYHGKINYLESKTFRGDYLITKKNQEKSQLNLENILGDLKISFPKDISLEIAAHLSGGKFLHRVKQLNQINKTDYTRRMNGEKTIITLKSNQGNVYLKDH